MNKRREDWAHGSIPFGGVSEGRYTDQKLRLYFFSNTETRDFESSTHLWTYLSREDP